MRILLTAASLLILSSGCHIMPRFHSTRTVNDTIETEPLTAIDLTTFNGRVSVEPHDQPVVEMEVTYKAYGGSEEEAEQNCELLDYEVSADAGKLVIKATKPSDQWMAAAGFKLKVPKTCELYLRSSNGTITVRDMLAKVDAHTSNGTIDLQRIQHDVLAKTSNGTITVADCQGTVNLTTSNGKINYSGIPFGLDNELRTSNGSISVRLPADQLTEIATRTSNGSIKCELPTQRILEEGKRRFHAIVGDGQVELVENKMTMRTSNGSIKVRPVEQPESSGGEITESDVEDEGSLVL